MERIGPGRGSPAGRKNARRGRERREGRLRGGGATWGVWPRQLRPGARDLADGARVGAFAASGPPSVPSAAAVRAVARDVALLAAVVARAVALVFVVRQEGRGEGEQGAEAGSGSDETNITTGRQDCRQTYHHRRRLKQRRPRWYYSCGLWRLVVEVTQGIQYAHSMLKVGRLGAPVRGWFTVYGAVDGVRNTKRIATPTHRRHGSSRSC